MFNINNGENSVEGQEWIYLSNRLIHNMVVTFAGYLMSIMSDHIITEEFMIL